MKVYLVLFVIFDILVTALILRHLLAKRAAAGDGAAAALLDIGKLSQFTQAIHPRVGEMVRANWSGDPAALPQVLSRVLDEVEREARSRGLTDDRGVLKRVIEYSLAKHRLARSGEVREALRQVA